jgi:very-short-patch-repair endonuclease/DNA modification methylase
MPRRKATSTQRPIESYDHPDKERVNNPPVGLVTPQTDPDLGTQQTYAYDPHLDPELQWAGKAEHTSFEVPTVSLHVHERIDPRTIVEAVRREPDPSAVQLSLFEAPGENPPIRQAIEFYKHKHGWSNRLIAGDSLLVMNSLLEKEGLGGQVQMIYIDPPYGIKYGSNFQPFVNKRDVKDGKDEDLTAEPEQIRAFRDTWELGIHSYLTYLRDRLLLARELLHESGSVFVQISDENVHHVRELMDEVFGAANFHRIVAIQKRAPQPDKYLSGIADYLLWYSKKREETKYHQLYHLVEDDSRATDFVTGDLTSSHEYHRTPFEFEGRVFTPGSRYWSTSVEGLQSLAKAGRLVVSGNTLRYKRLHSDWPCHLIGNMWDDVVFSPFMEDKLYAVQTSAKAIQRCLLMTTDPGDLVFDPTCVRKGTRVWVPTPALPANGEGVVACRRARGQGAEPDPPVHGNAEHSPPPVHGGIEGGQSPRGETKGGQLAQEGGEGKLIPIEDLRPGDIVLGHDGRPHRVLRVIERRYRGPMIGLRCASIPATLWLTSDHRVLARTRPRSLGGNRDWSAIPPGHFERSRELRHEASPPERMLWSALRNKQLGYKFRRQHPIGPYIADFYSREAHAVVEVDGSTHFTEESVAYDAGRDAYMRALDLDVLRFTTAEVQQNLEGVCLAIQDQCRQKTESPQGAEWIQSASLQPGDLVFAGPSQRAIAVESVECQHSEEEVYDLEIEGAHSFITELCTVHNCGSGTTAYVAEQWGRRWVTCDTSRVALTLVRQRLMTAVYDYYELAHPEEGVGSGFKYKTVPHVTLRSIANNPEIREGMSRQQIDAAIARHAPQETLYDQPYVDRGITRVSGPFTVEAVPAPAVRSVEDIIETSEVSKTSEVWADTSVARSGETLRQAEWRDELLKTGIRGKAGQRIRFARLEPLPGCRWLHADGETQPSDEGADSVREEGPAYAPQRIVLSFGPEHAPLEQRQVEHAWEEARTLVPKPRLLAFAAFQFDPEAAKDIDEMKAELVGMQFLKVQMNADLLTDDLKKKRASNESFWLIGQPDVQVERITAGSDKGKVRVSVHGFDYFNTKTGNLESGGAHQIAVWLLDTDYDGRSLFPRQVFFPMAGDKEGWARLARNLKADIDPDLIEAYRGTISLPSQASTVAWPSRSWTTGAWRA